MRHWSGKMLGEEAVSSQVVMARLKFVGKGQRQPGGLRVTSSTHMTVVCAYTPTAKAPLGVKTKIFDELQDTLDCVPVEDILVVLRDFNAWVRKREGDSDEHVEGGARGTWGGELQ